MPCPHPCALSPSCGAAAGTALSRAGCCCPPSLPVLGHPALGHACGAPRGWLFPPCAGTSAVSEPQGKPCCCTVTHPGAQRSSSTHLPSLPGVLQPFRHQVWVDVVPPHVSIPSHSSLHLWVPLGLNRDRLSPSARFLALPGMVSPEIKWDLPIATPSCSGSSGATGPCGQLLLSPPGAHRDTECPKSPSVWQGAGDNVLWGTVLFIEHCRFWAAQGGLYKVL